MKTWSVIIPTRNEGAHIGKCLESLWRLRYDLSSVEVIVADNGSVDRTLQVVSEYDDRLDITVLQIPGVRVGAVRNAGARAACGRFLAFLDADCEVGPDWLEEASQLLEKRATVIGAPYALPSEAGWPARVWFWRFDRTRSGQVSYVPAGNLLLPRDTFWSIGGFDAEMAANEDAQFCSRARAAGFDVVAYERLYIVHHGAERNLKHFARRQLWHGSAVINRAGLRANQRAIGLAAYTLACVCCFMLAVLLGSPTALLACLLGLFVPAVVLTLAGRPWKTRLQDAPLLIILIVTYSLARAAVLPIALLRGIPDLSRKTGRQT